MSREYIFENVGKDLFKVKKSGEEGHKEYLVDLNKGDMLCDCKGFYYNKKACKHIKFILGELAKKDKGIIIRGEE